MKQKIWALIATCVCLVYSVSPSAEVQLPSADGEVSLAGQIDYFEDNTAAMTLDQVRAEPTLFKCYPNSSDLIFGYSKSAFWLRLELNAPAIELTSAPRDWRLELTYSPLSYVDVFVPESNLKMSSGLLVPFSSRPVEHRNHVFPLAFAPGQHTVYIRVLTQSSVTMPVRLNSAKAFNDATVQSYLVLGLYYGLLFGLAAYNLLLFLSLRSAPYGYYVACVLALASGVSVMNGLGPQYLWPNAVGWNAFALPMCIVTSDFLAILFTRSLLQTQLVFPRFDRLLIAFAAILLAAIATMPWIPPYASHPVMSALTLPTLFLLFGLGIASMRRGVTGALYYLIAWSALLICGTFVVMRNLAWLPNNFFTQYGVQLGSAIEMVLLSFALAQRFHELKLEKEAAQAEALNLARKSELELEARVNRRTAALGEANARLAESEAQLRTLAHHDGLTGLANRLQFDAHLGAALARAQRMQQPLGLLVIDLDGFKNVNDLHGHAVGDALLIEAAHRLKQAMRTEDLVARMGGDEFVVVLEAPQTTDSIRNIAQKLLLSLERPVHVDAIVLNISGSIGGSIGGTILTDSKDDALSLNLMRQADAAMYAAKAAGRSQVRLHGEA